MSTHELNAEQLNEMGFLKSHYPYRIIYGVVDQNTGKFTASAVTTKAIPNKLARQGHTVFVLESK